MLTHAPAGTYMEFMDVVEILRKSTSPAYHIIVPSHIGYGFSSPPPVNRDFTLWEDAYLINQLMKGLGFEQTGYIVQAGDIGHWTARMLTHYPGCKGILCELLASPHTYEDLLLIIDGVNSELFRTRQPF